MTLRNKILAAVGGISLFGCGFVIAQAANPHPHLHQARVYGRQAYDELNAAERTGNPAADKHLDAAKHHLEAANQEIDAAIEAGK